MKASELRIWNLVYNQKTGIAKIRLVDDGLGCVGVQSKNGIFYGKIEEIEPIPLTEYWLIRMGFVNGEKEHFSFTKNMELRILGSEADYNGIWFGRLESVHQLQNLYFALTGEDEIPCDVFVESFAADAVIELLKSEFKFKDDTE